ncbi:MAG: hypothetical protein U9R25_05560 [Chloroflexota bacterium]|nr:hypothetical protein [Chloroflexota bacterium]
MSELIVRDVSKSEIKQIAGWFIEDHADNPMYARMFGGTLRRLLYHKWVLPRYLQNAASIWLIEEGDDAVGYVVVERSGAAIHLADLVLYDDDLRAEAVGKIVARARDVAQDKGYRYIGTAPGKTDEDLLQTYRDSGFEFLDYYLWAFSGQVMDIDAPEGVDLPSLGLKSSLEQRLHYLGIELDASEVAARDLIESNYLPKKPAKNHAFEIELTRADGGTQGIGYLSPRPDERKDGVLSLVLSTDPAYWGTPLEAQIVGAFANATSEDETVPVRVMVSTTAHAEQSQDAFADIGLVRGLDARPVMYIDIEER